MEKKPIWVSSDGSIFLETFHELSKVLQEFLCTIAEPVSRPHLIHEYKITPYSLYAAISIGFDPSEIIAILQKLSKTGCPEDISKWIIKSTSSYGKIKIVLKNSAYHIEADSQETFDELYRDNVISKLVSQNATPILQKTATNQTKLIEEMNESFSMKSVLLYKIISPDIELVKKRCIQLGYPVLEEFDLDNDESKQMVSIDLRPNVSIRPYQEQSLNKMFSNGRARSGIIVLPCGAGKTLVGILAAVSLRRSVLVLCTSTVSAEQWKQQFKQFTTLSDSSIARFTSDTKEKFTSNIGVVVSTYTMIAYSGKRSYDAKKIMEYIESREWGLIILDEVHVVPANVFRRVLSTVAAHVKLGLTATLVREDEKIDDLNFLIGPKLYEANWQDLSIQGHIANVQCAEVWCAMPPAFFKHYISDNSKKRKLSYIMNPVKIQTCQYLIRFHEARGDKIIVFSDNVYALKAYALKLGKPFIYGPTSQNERMQVLQQFQSNPDVNTIFLSKVGDTSIDLPEATCLIQISSHYGSRRQEAQRLGRILRAKKRNVEGFNAFFYTLVSKDTEEMFFSSKRQQFLIDQGYSYKTITCIHEMQSERGLAYSSADDQNELLREIILATDADADDECDYDDVEDYRSFQTNIGQISGASSMAYIETNRSQKILK